MRSETICFRTSTKSQSTVAAETTHTQSAKPAARRTNGLVLRRRVVRLPQGSPSSLEAESSLPPRETPPPTRASSSLRFRIFFPTRSGTAACTALSMPLRIATAISSAPQQTTTLSIHFHFCLSRLLTHVRTSQSLLH